MSIYLVGIGKLEFPRLTTSDPKSDLATNLQHIPGLGSLVAGLILFVNASEFHGYFPILSCEPIVARTEFESVIPRMKIWCPRPLDERAILLLPKLYFESLVSFI